MVVLALGGLGGSVTPAQGSIWTGSCALVVEFAFGSRVRSASFALTAPGYDITVSQAADLDPTTASTTEACATSLNVDPFRQTSAGGSGSSALWTCESTLGIGSWSQSWTPSLPPVFGSHVVAGTWGAWTMVVTNPSLSFSGVIELTIHPSHALKLKDCATSGIRSITMVGVMVFQDPQIPTSRSATTRGFRSF